MRDAFTVHCMWWRRVKERESERVYSRVNRDVLSTMAQPRHILKLGVKNKNEKKNHQMRHKNQTEEKRMRNA